jgi:hypothetical protein
MDQGWAAVVVAVITTVGGLLGILIQTMRKEAREMRTENAEDHAIVQGQLQRIYRTINRVDDKLEKHLDQHREGLPNEQTPKRNKV